MRRTGRWWWAALVGWAAALFTGAALGAGGAMLELTEQDCGREREVAAGEMIRLVLPEPGGTGYLWEPRDPDPARLQLVESTTARRGEKQLLGGTLDRIFLWRAIAPGKVRLTLELRRPWEKGEPPAKSCTLHVHIR